MICLLKIDDMVSTIVDSSESNLPLLTTDQVANVGIVDLVEDHRALWDIKRRGVGYKKPCPVGSREVRNTNSSSILR